MQLAEDNPAVVAAIAAGANLVAGTSWLWARSEMSGVVQTLFVDEAGQTSLAVANAVAVASAAPALVLLGDPRRLRIQLLVPEPNFAPRSFGRPHELSNRSEYLTELAVLLLLQRIHPPRQV